MPKVLTQDQINECMRSPGLAMCPQGLLANTVQLRKLIDNKTKKLVQQGKSKK